MAKVRKMGKPVMKNSAPVSEGVEATDIQEDDIRMVLDEKQPRKQGNWIKVTLTELAKHEADGVLMGYDPATGEALLKE